MIHVTGVVLQLLQWMARTQLMSVRKLGEQRPLCGSGRACTMAY